MKFLGDLHEDLVFGMRMWDASLRGIPITADERKKSEEVFERQLKRANSMFGITRAQVTYSDEER